MGEIRVTLDEELAKVSTIFLDTAPIIYYVENYTRFADEVEKVIQKLDAGTFEKVSTSNSETGFLS